jgi:hypothetical protein
MLGDRPKVAGLLARGFPRWWVSTLACVVTVF